MTDLMAGRDGFVFAVGIEDTSIGSRLRGGTIVLDEYELTGHSRQWRADLDRAAGTGATMLRYGFPWHRVNPAPGVFDWSWTDQVIDHLSAHPNMKVALELVHYGAPTWLEGSFTDPRFPEALAGYAQAVATRYRGAISAYTPLNEPLVTASFCGLRAIWPPYLRGDDGWTAVLVAAVAGIQQAMRAVRGADPAAEIVHVEAVQLYMTEDSSLEDEVKHWERRAQLPTRLLLGSVSPEDEDWSWLERHGVDPAMLEQLRVGGERPDVLGLNYYPELSCRELVRLDRQVVHVTADGGIGALEGELRRCHAAYNLPLMVTESALEGATEKQCAWLDQLVAGLQQLRAEGLPILGLTWWPLFDFVDWSWASGGTVVEEFYQRDGPGQQPHPVPPPGAIGAPITTFLRRMGIYRLAANPDGELARQPTDLLTQFQAHVARSTADHVHVME